MGIYVTPQHRELDTNGDPQNGARLFFYEAGTSTPLDTYSDAALASANTNPVVADANGRFGRIYGNTTQAYKVVLKTSVTDGDTQIWEEDNYYFAEEASDALGVRLGQIAANPLDQGADGDGVDDEATEVQAAIDAAETAGTLVVNLLGLIYRCDSQLSLHSNLTIKDGTIDMSQKNGSTIGILAEGSIGNSVNITSDVTVGDATISTDSVAFTDDAYIYASDSTNWDAAGNNDGMLMQIFEGSGGTVSLRQKTEMGFTSASAATVRELTMIENITFENVTFIGNLSHSASFARFTYAKNIKFLNCTFQNMPDATGCIDFAMCADVLMEGCQFEKAGIGSGETLLIGTVCRGVTLRRCRFNRQNKSILLGDLRSGVFFDGITRDVLIEDCIFEHGTGTAPIHIRGGSQTHNVTIRNNYFNDDVAASSAMDLDGAAYTVIGNEVQDFGTDSINYTSTVASTADFIPVTVRIEDNYINEAGGDGIYVDNQSSSTTIRKISIRGNYIENPASEGIVVDDTANVRHTDISRNTIHSSGSYGIDVNCNAELITVTDNFVSDAGNNALDFANISAKSVSVMGGRYETTAAFICINIASGASTTAYNISGVSVDGGAFGIDNNSGTTSVQYVAVAFGTHSNSDDSGTFANVTGRGSGGSSGTLVETT